jgi:hypothetical protein
MSHGRCSYGLAHVLANIQATLPLEPGTAARVAEAMDLG